MTEAMRPLNRQCLSLIALFAFTGNLTRGEEIEAFTEPYKRVAVPAAEIGVISEILVSEGDEISESQLLAKLEDSVLQSSLKVAQSAMEAKGALLSAESEMAVREKQLMSYRALLDRGNATQREFERAEADYQQSAARRQSVLEDLEVRRLEYERVKAQINQRIIQSPITGHVVAIEKEVGEFVSPTDPVIMHVVHLETLKSVFSVPLAAAEDLRVGQIVRLSLGYTGDKCDGIIEFVSPVADAESGSVRVKVRIPNREGRIQSGVVCRWNLNVATPIEKTTRVHSRTRATH